MQNRRANTAPLAFIASLSSIRVLCGKRLVPPPLEAELQEQCVPQAGASERVGTPSPTFNLRPKTALIVPKSNGSFSRPLIGSGRPKVSVALPISKNSERTLGSNGRLTMTSTLCFPSGTSSIRKRPSLSSFAAYFAIWRRAWLGRGKYHSIIRFRLQSEFDQCILGPINFSV